MKKRKLSISIVVATAAILLAGCGEEVRVVDTPSPTTPSATWSPDWSVTAPPTATPPVAPRVPILEAGRHAAWLTGIDRRARTLTFDVIQWLTGHAADEAFHRDHPEAPDAEVPNGYYIVNQNRRLRTLHVALNATVSVLSPLGGTEQRSIPFDQLPTHLAGDLDPGGEHVWHNPFWLTVHNDRIYSIVEQYQP